ncbi:outer membrane beta-barrel domain-containing protein [Bradymonadaceae bacterium TMQ3]|uniref:Outer membrane beta-barrel domain-containing protein n=2 Tax=Lujinxingia sediminis TaxID=2480984 RepID=A0ABY0CVQ1_9DELT|nr:outer membrane beta-barrel domain-containing protein [Bradymonadaceae bacterium TMQ3]RVU47952.1 outer membrane beta-barrel domain-containing protein [Lujinxingia sediminis]TXC77253.1 outer membrane beta-barrel domain-containing protein [Bradymonadales bacterium TMQ1]
MIDRSTEGSFMTTVKFKWSAIAVLVAAATALSASPAAAQQALDEELEQYWTSERDLRVLRDRLYDREGRIGAGIYTGLMSSEPFYYYIPVGGRVSYHFSDQLGVEVGGAFMNAQGVLTRNTQLMDFLVADRGEGFDAATDTEDRFLWRANAVVTWSPFYGKLALLQRKLSHFDLNVAAGLGAVSVERPNQTRDAANTKLTVEGVLGVGAHFFVTPDLTVRLDGRGYIYRGAKFDHNEDSFFGQLRLPVEFLVGASYHF